VIPSYDDLTPGIPDVIDSESVSQLALFLRDDLNRKSEEPAKSDERAKQIPPDLGTSCLYACLCVRTANHELPTANKLPTANCQLQTLLAVARDFSPRVMRVSDTEVLLDVSGLGRLIGAPPAVAAELARALREAGMETASVAIAETQTAARLLASAGPVPLPQFPDYPITQLPNLPVTALQPLETLPPAINHRDRARPYEIFELWGIATLGDLTALPVAQLSSRLGRRGVALHRLARGLDPRPFVPDTDTPRYIGRLELEWPIEQLEPLSFVFARLLEPLSTALERADRGAAALRLDLRLTDRQVHTRVLQLPAPMRDARVLRTLLLLDLESHPPSPLCAFGETGPPSAAVDVVSIELDPAPARITQFSLLERALPSPETLSTLTARLSALVGESRVGSAVLIDTHQPGAFAMKPFRPESTVREAARSGVCGEPVLRRQRIPPAIRVRVEQGRPVHIAAARRGMPSGGVTQAAGPWRTSGGWWSGTGAAGLGPGHGAAGLGSPKRSEGGWNRDEWDVALASGAVCRIFQDRPTGCWFLEGTYD
jgi:protein ImuB